MTRKTMLGAGVFGLLSAVAGYVWVAFEFPFAVLLPAAVGWYVVTRSEETPRTAFTAALVGGVSFTAVLLVGMFLAITDGSPLPINGAIAALAAAAAAGALTGWVLDRGHGALVMAVSSTAGMAVAVAVSAVLRQLAPASTETPGLAQSGWAAMSLGLVGAFVGAAVGFGVAWISQRRALDSGRARLGGTSGSAG